MIEITTTRHSYNGNGATVDFAYDFPIDAKTELRVLLAGVLQTEGTHYTVSGVGEAAGGEVSFVTAPETGTDNVVIERVTPATQLIDLPAAGPFLSAAIEGALDKLTKLIQELQNDLIESFKNVEIAAAATSDDLFFTTAADDANYQVYVTTNWATTWRIPDAQKLTTGFRIEFTTAAPANAVYSARVYT